MCKPKLSVTIIVFLATFLLGLRLVHSYDDQRLAWKGKIETAKGIKVIKNLGEPVYGEFAPQLEEDLAIGDEKDETYYFPKGGSLNVDAEGNLYVCDFGNRRVQMYDKAGKYVRTIGRQGQGPGEYMFPSQVLFDSEGNLCVGGGRDLNFYTKDGAFLRKSVLKAPLNFYILGPVGTVIGKLQPSPVHPMESLIQLDAGGNVIRTIADFPGLPGKNKNAYVWHWYSPGIALAPLTSETFAYGYTAEYKIYVADGEGRTILIMTKEEKSQSISSPEKEAAHKEGYAWSGDPGSSNPRDLMEFPGHQPYFSNFIADDEGRLYVGRSKSILDKSPASLFDIFSRDGFYLYRTKLNFWPQVIKRDAFYEIRRNEETGDIKIIRHIIKNLAQFRTGFQ